MKNNKMIKEAFSNINISPEVERKILEYTIIRKRKNRYKED